tara:strand:- start:63 stop:314 length:252 start_codon:yes stop_codon:yes gene_type:complete
MVNELSALAEINMPPAPTSAAAFAVVGVKLITEFVPARTSVTDVVVVLADKVKVPVAFVLPSNIRFTTLATSLGDPPEAGSFL